MMNAASSGSAVASPMMVTVGADFMNTLANSAKNAVSEGGGGGAAACLRSFNTYLPHCLRCA